MEVLEKHKRYLEHHVPGEVFWGLGLENETYIELYDGKYVTAEFLLKHQMRERYSVNYWLQYKKGVIAKVLSAWIAKLPHGPNTSLRLPLLVNGHTFTKCDPWGEHATVQSTNPSPNPKFAKQTLLEMLEVADPVVFGKEQQGIWWCFDGDTVEFMTQDFRCATVQQVLKELAKYKRRWITSLQQTLPTLRCESVLKGPVGWPKLNHGFAVFLTNRRNVAIFNNGTYHINITAPSRLGKDGEIEDWPRFLHIHRQAARLFQWLSPFLVAAYGSGDIFAQIGGGTTFPAGSQRLAASRYVSAGTFDTRLMPRGKMVTTSTAEMVPSPTWWHEMYDTRRVAYEKLEAIGYDINFNKFPNHGLEFRIFDWFGEEALGELLEMLVVMMDRAMAVDCDREVPFPQDSVTWRRILGRTVWEGSDALLLSHELRVFAAAVGVPSIQHPHHRTVMDTWDLIKAAWKGRRDGPCSSRMLEPLPIKQQQQKELVTRIPTLSHQIEPSLDRTFNSSNTMSCISYITYTEAMEIRQDHTQSLLALALDPHTPLVRSIGVQVDEVVSRQCCILPYFSSRRRTIP